MSQVPQDKWPKKRGEKGVKSKAKGEEKEWGLVDVLPHSRANQVACWPASKSVIFFQVKMLHFLNMSFSPKAFLKLLGLLFKGIFKMFINFRERGRETSV